MLFLDGALLIELWDDLELSEPIRQAWALIIAKCRNVATQDGFYIPGDETRHSPVQVIKHADDG